jgi:hypothetical protein
MEPVGYIGAMENYPITIIKDKEVQKINATCGEK